jgi:uncharacterized UPF0160 family protein
VVQTSCRPRVIWYGYVRTYVQKRAPSTANRFSLDTVTYKHLQPEPTSMFVGLNRIRCKALSQKLAVAAILSLQSVTSYTIEARKVVSFSFSSHPRHASGNIFRLSYQEQYRMTSSSTTYKRAKILDNDDPSVPPSDKVIGTHSGTFQADEAMGCWMLRQLPEYRNARIVRSRDPVILGPLPIVIDVGGIYDHAKLRYDHHQRGYDERFPFPRIGLKMEEPRCTKLSASGLVYLHYGKQVIQQFYPSLPPHALDLAYVKLYDTLLEALDAIDTGVELVPVGTTPVYKDSTGLASRVGRLNPRWNEEEEVDPDVRFSEAVQICGIDFVSCLTAIVESDLPARDFVERALLQRYETCPSGEVIALEAGGMPWKNHLYDLERVHNVDPLIKFVLYEDSLGGMWRIQAVTVEGSGFTNRLSLPEEWRGVRDEDLEGVTKIVGSRFVHAAGFIGGATTYEGVVQMAQTSLKQKEANSEE